MGLDIYFNKRRFSDKVQTEVAYFRKVNSLVGWMERNVGEVENCKDLRVSKDQLQDLLDDARAVLRSIEGAPVIKKLVETGSRKNDETGQWETIMQEAYDYDPEYTQVAMELLPPTVGFFFGNTSINKRYVEDVKDIIKQIKIILKKTDFNNEGIYFNCWW